MSECVDKRGPEPLAHLPQMRDHVIVTIVDADSPERSLLRAFVVRLGTFLAIINAAATSPSQLLHSFHDVTDSSPHSLPFTDTQSGPRNDDLTCIVSS